MLHVGCDAPSLSGRSCVTSLLCAEVRAYGVTGSAREAKEREKMKRRAVNYTS
jgi:hypothetical protein